MICLQSLSRHHTKRLLMVSDRTGLVQISKVLRQVPGHLEHSKSSFSSAKNSWHVCMSHYLFWKERDHRDDCHWALQATHGELEYTMMLPGLHPIVYWHLWEWGWGVARQAAQKRSFWNLLIKYSSTLPLWVWHACIWLDWIINISIFD